MHESARLIGAGVMACYGGAAAKILDVGSRDVNGTLRGYAPPSVSYIGIDMEAGLGVDVVPEDPYRYPFDDNRFDLVVSTSCFEHDQMFWLSFCEMVRVVRPGGFIYINAPSTGPYHGHPGDCWRFYPDAPKALAAWAKRCGYELEVVETLMVVPGYEPWGDNVSVYGKLPVSRRPRLADWLTEQSHPERVIA